MSGVVGQVEWPSSPSPVLSKTIGHCSTCEAGRVSNDAPITRIDHISAIAEGRFICFCDACLAVIAKAAPVQS